MPPHCDTRDGPVVTAAKQALQEQNVNYVLVWVPKGAEEEVRRAFDRTLKVRANGKEVQDLADDWFFETVVRLHRAGEGASFTGLRPAGLDEGPVVPRAEEAIETGNPHEVIGFVLRTVEEDLEHRFRDIMAKKQYGVDDVEAGRAYVQAFLNFVVYAHHLYTSVTSGSGHGHHGTGREWSS